MFVSVGVNLGPAGVKDHQAKSSFPFPVSRYFCQIWQLKVHTSILGISNELPNLMKEKQVSRHPK